MGKGRRLKNLRRMGNSFRIIIDEQVDTESDFFKQVVLGEGNENITDELIIELIADNSFTEKDLRDYQQQGAKYCRPRKSFIFPPEFGSCSD
ncbi:MAG: hypothetical protein C4518_01425 [Desulfobacteraceae bacterium]|nr:MAG: hypothetical protein C4518_01425 [Desulfobacteraceae bacterium]